MWSHPRLARLSSPANLGMVMALLAAVLASGKAVLVKQAYALGAEPVPLLAVRMGLAAPFFLVLLGRLPGPRPAVREVAGLVGLGLVGFYVSACLDFAGLVYLSAGLERVVLYLHPTMVLALAWVLGWGTHEAVGPAASPPGSARPTAGSGLLGIAVAWAGLVLAVAADLPHAGEGFGLGVTFVLGAALLYAVYLLWVDRWGRRLGIARVASFAQLVSAGALGLHTLALPAADRGVLAAPVWGYGLALAVFCTVLPSLLLAGAITRLGPARASAAGMVGPVSASLLGAAFLGERLTVLQLAGGAVVVVGVALLRPRAALSPGEPRRYTSRRGVSHG